MNIVIEQVLPKYWIFGKSDDKNIKDIVNRHADLKIAKIKTFPFLSYGRKRYYDHVLKLEVFSPLNWIDYNYDAVKKRIIYELDWRDYGGKHYESVWTRFYQRYILPNKFNIDKRKAHFSNLIFSNQITKEEALDKLSKPILSAQLERDDKEFIMKKFGLSDADFDKIMSMPRKEHSEFEVEKGFRGRVKALFGIS